MALTGKTNEEKIWNFLKEKGLNDFGVAGTMGNIFAESSLNPKNLQNNGNKILDMTDDQYTSAVDNNTYSNFVYNWFICLILGGLKNEKIIIMFNCDIHSF